MKYLIITQQHINLKTLFISHKKLLNVIKIIT